MDCPCRDHPDLGKFAGGSDVEIDSAIWHICILNILRFGFPNILLLLCVAIVTSLSAFSIINFVCQIFNLLIFHKKKVFLYLRRH